MEVFYQSFPFVTFVIKLKAVCEAMENTNSKDFGCFLCVCVCGGGVSLTGQIKVLVSPWHCL